MRQPLIEIPIKQTRAAAEVYDSILFDISASGAVWDEPLLNAWCTNGCRRSARLSTQKRYQALQWRIGEVTRAALDAASWRRQVFGRLRGAAIARRRDAMLAEIFAAPDMAAAFERACSRFLAIRKDRARRFAALADDVIAATRRNSDNGSGSGSGAP